MVSHATPYFLPSYFFVTDPVTVGSLRSAIGLLAADVETQGGQGGGPGGARAIGARSAWRAQYEPTELERTGNSGSSATRTSALSHHLQGIA